MAKDRYMALEDFQTLWTNSIKPAVLLKADVATVSESSNAANELT